MPLISSYQIRCQFLVLVQKHTTSNPLTQFALSNLVTHIFTVDMFPYKITQPLQSSVQSLNFQKSSEICCFPAFISLFYPADTPFQRYFRCPNKVPVFPCLQNTPENGTLCASGICHLAAPARKCPPVLQSY